MYLQLLAQVFLRVAMGSMFISSDEARTSPARTQGTWPHWRMAPAESAWYLHAALPHTLMRVGPRPRKKAPIPPFAYNWRVASVMPRNWRSFGSTGSVCRQDLTTSIGYIISQSCAVSTLYPPADTYSNAGRCTRDHRRGIRQLVPLDLSLPHLALHQVLVREELWR